MSEKSDVPKTSPSLHSTSSYPDPADEDVLVKKASRDDANRPGLVSSKRHSSYTSLLTTRNFTPEFYGEPRWTNQTTKSHPHSNRAPSDGTSVTDDWKTALNGSTTDEKSSKSRSRSDSHNEKSSLADKMNADPERLLNEFAEMINDEDHVNEIRSPSLLDAPVATPRQLSQRLSAANLRKQAQSHEEEMRTPQPRTYLASGVDVTENHAVTPDVLLELEQLKRRIDSLEFTGSVNDRSPFSTMDSPSSAERIRSSTLDNFSAPSQRRSERVQRPFASPGEARRLRTAIDKLRDTHAPSEVVQPLEMAVADALVLSATCTDQAAQLRATTLCKSLTSLCVALKNLEPESTLSPSTMHSNYRARSRTIENHLAGLGSASNSANLSRARSSRKSLAEIMGDSVESRSNSPALQATRSFSRASRLPDRVSALSRSDYDDSRSEQQSTYSRAPSVMSGAGGHGRAWQTETFTDHARRRSVYGQELDSDRWSKTSHARAPSRAASEILERSPVTRESLYARYRRSPESQSKWAEPT